MNDDFEKITLYSAKFKYDPDILNILGYKIENPTGNWRHFGISNTENLQPIKTPEKKVTKVLKKVTKVLKRKLQSPLKRRLQRSPEKKVTNVQTKQKRKGLL